MSDVTLRGYQRRRAPLLLFYAWLIAMTVYAMLMILLRHFR